jgi:aspartate aminotransferase
MSKYQSQSLSSPCSISQKAAITALNLDWDFIRPYVHTYRERLSWVKDELATIPGLHILDTRATFYIFPQICSLKKYQECGNDVKFCEELLKQTGLCLVPGSSFGLEGHIRISCSYDMATIKKGIARLKAYLSE